VEISKQDNDEKQDMADANISLFVSEFFWNFMQVAS